MVFHDAYINSPPQPLTQNKLCFCFENGRFLFFSKHLTSYEVSGNFAENVKLQLINTLPRSLNRGMLLGSWGKHDVKVPHELLPQKHICLTLFLLTTDAPFVQTFLPQLLLSGDDTKCKTGGS